MFDEMTAEAIADRLHNGDNLLLIDVREPGEWELASIAGAEQRSMSTLNEWWQDVPTDRDVVIFCHHGGRSAHVCTMLASQAGLSNLINMAGGIDRWSLVVDQNVPRY